MGLAGGVNVAGMLSISVGQLAVGVEDLFTFTVTLPIQPVLHEPPANKSETKQNSVLLQP